MMDQIAAYIAHDSIGGFTLASVIICFIAVVITSWLE